MSNSFRKVLLVANLGAEIGSAVRDGYCNPTGDDVNQDDMMAIENLVYSPARVRLSD